jgi:hypothetical protein
MDAATGSIYLGYPGVDRHHLIIQNTLGVFPSFLVSWTLTKRSEIAAIYVVHHDRVSRHISPSSYIPRAGTTRSQEFPSDTMRGAAECS